MTDGIMEFILDYLPQFVSVGFVAGAFAGGVPALLSYMIGKVQGFFDN